MNQSGGVETKVRLRRMKFKNNQPTRSFNNPVGKAKNKFSVQGRLQKFKQKNVNKDAIIAENLQHMKEAAFKKRMAQNAYYNKMNRQPNQGLVTKPKGKQPTSVHQRLGANGNNIRSNQFRTRYVGNSNMQNKIVRVQTAQQRLGKIRQQQGVNGFKQITVNNAVRGQMVKLKRANPRYLQQPQQLLPPVKDYTISVDNNSVGQPLKHCVIGSLNPVLQSQIKTIQHSAAVQQNIPQYIIPPYPIHVPGSGFTRLSLHNRFSLM